MSKEDYGYPPKMHRSRERPTKTPKPHIPLVTESAPLAGAGTRDGIAPSRQALFSASRAVAHTSFKKT